MSRSEAIARAVAYLDDGGFQTDLARRVRQPTESQTPEKAEALRTYLSGEMTDSFTALGFTCSLLETEAAPAPFLLAVREEDPALPTVLGYGHGDVVRGMEGRWAEARNPWAVTAEGDRLYGRGTADNKGQLTVNLGALKSVLETRGRLGFNVKYLIEMGEEVGSPGLREVCAAHRAALAADLLIASDGPRLSADRPTLFLGSRGGLSFDLVVRARDGAHHSGNWGGLLSNPAVPLAHALSALIGPSGQIAVPALVPPGLPDSVRRALADCTVDGGPGGPTIDADWGEPGLSPAERVFGWSALEVLAMEAGTPAAPVNAIPGHAWARLQLRFVVGVEMDGVLDAVRAHLDRAGLSMVEVRPVDGGAFPATRLDPEDPWVDWALTSLERTTGKAPALLPNLGGSLPNDAFAGLLGLRTLWVPHSYPACSQHAPDEHLLASVAREGLAAMAGLYWDLGEADARPAL